MIREQREGSTPVPVEERGGCSGVTVCTIAHSFSLQSVSFHPFLKAPDKQQVNHIRGIPLLL